MKPLSLLIFLVLGGVIHAQDVAIGEEYILPLRYPKFSMTGEYEFNRKFYGFADDKLRVNDESRFDGTLSFEAGLLKYFNAGALFGVGIKSFKKPVHFRFGLFAKPFFPIGERFAIFTRIAGGFAVDLFITQTAQEYYARLDTGDNFKRVYKDQTYSGMPIGGFGAATVGLEFFPFSRFGLAVEFGIRAMIMHSGRNLPLVSKNEKVAGAPDSFNFMVYDLPLMVTLHWII